VGSSRRDAESAGHGRLASADEVEGLVAELEQLAADSTTLIAMPRVIEAWGVRPG
jgi:hypothetical protein